MRLVEYEQKIKDLVKEDRSNPEIYKLLQEMIYMFLRRKHIGNNPGDTEEVSYTFAGDLFMKISSGEEIIYYLGYLERKYKEYFKEYCDVTRFNEPYDPSLDDKKVVNLDDQLRPFDQTLNRVYLSNIYLIIDKIFDEKCKYRYNSYIFINLKVSLILSLLRDEITPFHLNSEQTEYLKILVVLFYNELKLG